MRSDEASDVQRLIARARNGDTSAVGLLLESYRSYLRLLIRLQAGFPSAKLDGSDIVQEVFLKASRNFVRFRGDNERQLVAWLRRILATTLADEARGARPASIRRIASALDQSSESLDRALISPASSPSQHAARKEQAVLLADALAALPDHYREVLILRHLKGMSFPQIARQLGRSLDSVKNSWARALVRLRDNPEAMP